MPTVSLRNCAGSRSRLSRNWEIGGEYLAFAKTASSVDRICNAVASALCFVSMPDNVGYRMDEPE